MAEDVKAVKAAKPAKQKKASDKKGPKEFFAKIGRFFKDLKGEFKKIVWPSKKQVFNNTLVVLVAMLLVGAFIALLDWGLGALLSLII
ncbi:MAG: preprotein translocase subunit SecE [Ruminococcaceae bacterium]|nr:preprotein translocase subunit SecE [Oscillospiraceae bacterium]